MPKPTISIVTPSYGQAAFLPAAVESVRAQRGGISVEHLVIDGGSTDGTVEYLREQPDVTWVSEPDRGQSHALNKGFAMARGGIIGWLNADDFYLDGAFQRVVEFMDANPDVAVVYGDCVFVDEAGSVVRAKIEHGFSRFVLRHYGCFIPSTATFFRRELFDRGLLFIEEDLHYVMDWDLFLRLESAGASFAYLPEPLAAFRWHADNKSLDDDRRLAERESIQLAAGVRPRARAGRKLTTRIARGVHLGMKLLSGGLASQAAWKRRAGEDMTWWPSGDSHE